MWTDMHTHHLSIERSFCVLYAKRAQSLEIEIFSSHYFSEK
jgi:hypothetical protein